jgi:hypothetical protein
MNEKLGPFELNKVHCVDALEALPLLPDGSTVVITDPQYGCGKAAWDTEFPTAWYPLARQSSKTSVIVTGSCGLKNSIALVGHDFLDVMAGRNLNGMTRGPLGFGNWLAVVVAGDKPRQGPNAFAFSVVGEKPDHPSPKPIEAMLWIVRRCTDPTDIILDPFMGSGTTGVAAVQLGRRFLGFEINQEYCDLANKRIEAARKGLTVKELEQGQGTLFES